MIGPLDGRQTTPGSRSERYEQLFEELRTLRQLGLSRVRDGHLPQLLQAATDLGHAPDDIPVSESLRRLLQDAIARLGESHETTAISQVFGTAPGTKMWSAADRRRSAARTQGVSVERFRRGYEPQMIRQVADEVFTMLGDSLAATATTPAPAARREPPLVDGMHIAGAIAAAHAKADWRGVRGAYRQCLGLAEDPDITSLSDQVLGHLSVAFDRLSATYAGNEETFALHAIAVLLDVDRAERISFEHLRSLYVDERFQRFQQFRSRTSPGRLARRPTPLEACIETTRRLRDLHTIRSLVPDLPCSAVLGGSSSYSRFYGIRGGSGTTCGSDVDLLLVVPGFNTLIEVADRLAGLEALDRRSLATLSSRARTFAADGLDDDRTVFSQKLHMWSDRSDPVVVWRPDDNCSYTIDVRLLSIPVLEWLLVADAPRIEADLAGNWRAIRDYCERSAYAEDHQRNFSGRNHRFTVDAQEVTDGVLRTSRAYYIDDNDRFYPGTLQNLVLPLLDCHWDGLAVRSRLDAFHQKIVNRVRHEETRSPHELLSLTFAHTRSEVFAPAVHRRLGS